MEDESLRPYIVSSIERIACRPPFILESEDEMLMGGPEGRRMDERLVDVLVTAGQGRMLRPQTMRSLHFQNNYVNQSDTI